MLTKKAMINRIKAITNGFRVVTKLEKGTNEDEVRAKLIADKLSACGWYSVQKVSLFEEITGYQLQKFINVTSSSGHSSVPKFFKSLVAVVPTMNDNGHNYTIGKPVICMFVNNASGLLKEDGTYGNTIGHSSNELRLATDEEIDKLTDAQLDILIREYSV